MTAPVAELRDVSLALGATPVLEDVSLRIETNDYLAILGPNGGGKTTLLKLLLGLHTPDRGQVQVLGGSPRRARGPYARSSCARSIGFSTKSKAPVRMASTAISTEP